MHSVSREGNPNRSAWVVLGLLILFLSCISYLPFVTKDRQPEVSGPIEAARSVRRDSEERERFFREQVLPILAEQKATSRASTQRCLQRIRERFQEYRRGVRPFAEDITSLWTRMGVLKRMPMDWWKQDGRTEEYIQVKFEKHIFSEQKLAKDLSDIFEQWKDDLQADQARLLSRIKIAVSESELPSIQLPSEIEFDGDVQDQLSSYVSRRATDSVYQGMVSLLASEMATSFATSLVTRVVVSLGTSVASSTATAGGATAGGAAAGAGGGSLAGPAGTAIGLGVGLVAGVAVDWWMTDRFRGQVEDELKTYLFQLEHGIIFGEGDQEGLESYFDSLLEDLTNAQRESLRSKLLQESSP